MVLIVQPLCSPIGCMLVCTRHHVGRCGGCVLGGGGRSAETDSEGLQAMKGFEDSDQQEFWDALVQKT